VNVSQNIFRSMHQVYREPIEDGDGPRFWLSLLITRWQHITLYIALFYGAIDSFL
jgi:hypothetical protein